MITFLDIHITEPASPTEPVTLATVKAWANIDITDDDDLLADMIEGARQDIENETNLALVQKDVTLYMELTKFSTVTLPYGEVTDLTLAQRFELGNEQDLTNRVDYEMIGSKIKSLGEGIYKATYKAGGTVPKGLQQAIKMLVTYRYNNRGDQDKQRGIPEDITSKVAKYAVPWL